MHIKVTFNAYQSYIFSDIIFKNKLIHDFWEV